MSADKYQGGIRAGIAGAISFGTWPAEVSGLGPMRGGQPFARCARCAPDAHPFRSGSFVKYGDVTLCKSCAVEAAA